MHSCVYGCVSRNVARDADTSITGVGNTATGKPVSWVYLYYYGFPVLPNKAGCLICTAGSDLTVVLQCHLSLAPVETLYSSLC